MVLVQWLLAVDSPDRCIKRQKSAGRNRHDKTPKDADLDDKRAVLGTNFGSIKVLDLHNMQLVSSGY